MGGDIGATAHATTYYKANNTAVLDASGTWGTYVGSVWTSGTAIPGINDIAAWDSNVTSTANGTTAMGGNLTFGGIQIGNSITGNPGGLVTITSTGGYTLGIGALGIDMSNPASSSANFNDSTSTILDASQTWNVSSGRTLTLSGLVTVGAADETLTLLGAGTVQMNGSSSTTGLSLNSASGSVFTIAGTIAPAINVITFSPGTAPMTFTGNPIAINYFQGITNNSSNPQLVTNNISLYTSSSSVYLNTTSGNIDLAGAISGSNGFSVNQAGYGMASLTSTSSSFTGAVTINNGILNVTKLALGGSNSSIGSASNAATNLNLVGTSTLRYSGPTATTDRSFTLGRSTLNSSGTLDASGSGPLTMTGSFVNGNNASSAATTTFTLTGTNTGANTLSNAVFTNASSTDTLGLIKSGIGSWTLAAPQTYTGTTTVDAGTLNIGNGTTGGLNTGDAVTMAQAGGTINFAEAPNSSQSLGALSISGGAPTIQSTYPGSGTTTLTFSSFARSANTAVNFVSSGGTAGSTNSIILTGQTGNTLVGGAGSGATFNGNDFAWVDSTTAGLVRGINYGVDPNSINSSGGTSITGTYVQLSGNISAQLNTIFSTVEFNGNRTFVIGSSTHLNQTISIGEILQANGSSSSVSTISSTSGGAIELGSYGSLIRTNTVNDSLTISCPIAANGTSSLVKTGAGTLTLSSTANLYAPSTIIDGGILNIAGDGSLGASTNTVTMSGGTLQLGNNITSARNITLGYGGGTIDTQNYNATLSGVISSTVTTTFGGTSGEDVGCGFTKVGSGTLTLSGANTYIGLTTLAGGVLNLGVAEVAGTSGPLGKFSETSTNTITYSPDIVFSGGTLQYSAANQYDYSPRFSIDPNQQYSVDTNGQAITWAAPLISSGGTLAVTDSAGGGSLTLNAVNTYSGGTTLNGGTLNVGIAGTLGSGSLTVNNPNTGAGTAVVLNLSTGVATTVGSLSGSIAAPSSGTNTATINTASGQLFTVNQTVAGTFAGAIAGAGAFTLGASSSAKLTLSGSNTYTGATTILAGTLAVGATNTLSPSSAMNVSTGTLNASGYANTVASLIVGSGGTLDLGFGNVLTSTGAATLAGTLNLSGTVGTLPETLMTYSSETGSFTTTTGIPTGDKLVYTTSALEIITSGPANLTWDNAGGSGNGSSWDTVSQNWNNGSAASTFSNTSNTSNGDNVTFNDTNNSHYAVTVNTTVTPNIIAINSTSNTSNYNFSGAGIIGGGGGLTMNVSGSVSISNTGPNAWGNTTVNGGTLNLGSQGALPVNQTLTIASGASVVASNHSGGASTITVLQVNGLANSGTIDLTNNDLVIHATSGLTLAQVTAQVTAGYNGGAWNGTGAAITSSFAANPATNQNYLTAVGVATGLTSSNFENQGLTVASSDIVVKYTYYGDANLDGGVDGSDYTLIDNGFNNHFTGWQNGDFNYDGVVDGSDYTLIDNAYNTQGASLGTNAANLIASATAQIAGGSTAVPEPTTLGLLGIGAVGLIGRRRRRH